MDKVKEYFNKKSIHYSLLSKVASGYDTLKTYLGSLDDDEKKKSWVMVRGSLVDMLLTESEKIKDYFYIADFQRPTATLLELADLVLNYMDSETIPEKEVAELSDAKKFWEGTKDPEKRIKKFNTPVFWEYLKHMWNCREKNLITTKEFADAEYLVSLVKTHEYTKEYFHPDNDILFQTPIYWKENINDIEEDFKALLDMIVINHKDKTIKPIDIKTMEASVNKFYFNYKSFNYYLQGGLYSKGIRELIAQSDKKYEEYTIENFTFIVLSNRNDYPLVYQMGETDLSISVEGYTKSTGYRIKGLNELIEEWQWYEANGVDKPREVVENNGKIILNVLTE